MNNSILSKLIFHNYFKSVNYIISTFNAAYINNHMKCKQLFKIESKTNDENYKKIY